MTREELGAVLEAKVTKCIPCLVWAEMGNMPFDDIANCCDWDHKKSGNIRRGHKFGFAACLWHHKGHIDTSGWTFRAMRAHFGPALTDGSKLFQATYGTDDVLIARQRELLGLEVL